MSITTSNTHIMLYNTNKNLKRSLKIRLNLFILRFREEGRESGGGGRVTWVSSTPILESLPVYWLALLPSAESTIPCISPTPLSVMVLHAKLKGKRTIWQKAERIILAKNCWKKKHYLLFLRQKHLVCYYANTGCNNI